jgi:hypothetical protein
MVAAWIDETKQAVSGMEESDVASHAARLDLAVRASLAQPKNPKQDTTRNLVNAAWKLVGDTDNRHTRLKS